MDSSQGIEEKILGANIGSYVHRGVGIARGADAPNLPRGKKRKRRVNYDPKARDADADQLVQEGTTAERRVAGGASQPIADRGSAQAVVKPVKPRPRLPTDPLIGGNPLFKPQKLLEDYLTPKERERAAKDFADRITRMDAQVQKEADERAAALEKFFEGGSRLADYRPPERMEYYRNPVNPHDVDRAAIANVDALAEVEPDEPEEVPAPLFNERVEVPRKRLPPRKRPRDPATVVGGRPAGKPLKEAPPLEERNKDIEDREIREALEASRVLKDKFGDVAYELSYANAPRELRRLIDRHAARTKEVLEQQRLKKQDLLGTMDKHHDQLEQERASVERDIANLTETLMRHSLYGEDMEDVYQAQERVLFLQARLTAYDEELRLTSERIGLLEGRDASAEHLDDLRDPGMPLDERQLAYERLDRLARRKAQDALNNAGNPNYKDEIDHWENVRVQMEQGYAKLLDDKAAAGVRDLKKPSDFAEVGGPKLQQRQANIDDALERNLDSEDKSELVELRENLKAERDGLGPMETPTGDNRDVTAQANNRRRWLDANLMELNKATGVSSGSRMDFYPPASDNRPAVMPSLGNGPLAPVNPAIKTNLDAVNHIRNGGSLSEVPNEFWGAAISGNSSLDERDPNSKFKVVIPPNGGIGDTRLYYARDARGNATQFGYVTKASSADADQGNEMMSQVLAVEHGLPVESSHWDGQRGSLVGPVKKENVSNDAHVVVLPIITNALPEGEIKFVPRSGDDYDRTLFSAVPGGGAETRFHHFLHNYMMGTGDRHNANGMSLTVDGVPFALPLDQGAATSDTADIFRYEERFLMDSDNGWGSGARLFDDIASTVRRRPEFQEPVRKVYDGMIERTQSVVARRQEIFEAASRGMTDEVVLVQMRIVLDEYENRAQQLINQRERIFRTMGLI